MRPTSISLIMSCLLLPAMARSAPPVMQVDASAADHCPDTDEVVQQWNARQPAGAEQARVEIIISAERETLIGLVRVETPGTPPAARRLGARRHACQPLVNALLTAAALMAAPLDLPAPPPEPPPPPPEPSPLPEVPPPAEPDAPPPAAPAPGDGWWAGVATRADGGSTPNPTLSGELSVLRRSGRWSGGGGMQIGGTTTASIGAGGAGVERYAMVLRGCYDPALDLCLVGRGGAVRITPEGLDGGNTVEADVAIGAAVGWRLVDRRRWTLALDLEALAPLRRLRLAADGAAGWTAWAVAIGGGVTIRVRP